MSDQAIAILVFGLTYLLLIFKRERSLYFVWGASLLLILLGIISPQQAWQALNWNVLGLFFGTMILAELFVASGAPAYMATRMVNASGSAALSLLTIVIFSGLLSAVVENVATVFIVAPLAFETARKVKASPVPVLISVAIAANMQGVATMIGDSPSILLATAANLTFLDFFWVNDRPGIFFAVQIGFVVAMVIVYNFLRNTKGTASKNALPVVHSWTPSLLILLLVVTLSGSSFVPGRIDFLPGIIAVTIGLIALLWNHSTDLFAMELSRLDWQTFFLLAGLFVLISSLTVTGVITEVATLMTAVAGDSLLIAFLLIVVVSVVVSALVDNIPYTIAMLPVAHLLAERMDVNPLLFMFAFVLSTSLGGNITPIGASANVVAVGMLKREGYSVSFGEFMKIGLPTTIVAVTIGAAFLWFIWL
ncbi:MAG: putative transporter [Firmicutes bacterium]|nr:putative transporter [Bacillota bacterium]